MKILIVYDSLHGNTEKVARAIGGALNGEVTVSSVGEAGSVNLETVDLLVVGSPTHGGRPTPAVQSLLDRIPDAAARRLRVAAFDTRLSNRLVGMFGYAAPRIADSLKAKGSALAMPPEGFFVKTRIGPLRDGELERAAAWAGRIAQ